MLLFIFILGVGLISTRAKFYGFYGVAIALLIYCKFGGVVSVNFKSVLVLSLLILIAVALSWEKITLYYIDGMMTSGNMWSRPAMMLTGLLILEDYFPFGSGLASFGTYPSGLFYSSIYAEYGIDGLWGLTKERPVFVCDAFYPELAQFGICGVCLYCYFWIMILRKALMAQKNNVKLFVLVLMVFVFFFIEGIADSTFTHNRGLFILIVLGCSLPYFRSK